jgi:hypothetical protein
VVSCRHVESFVADASATGLVFAAIGGIAASSALPMFATAGPHARPRLTPPSRHGCRDQLSTVGRLRPDQVGAQVDERIDDLAVVPYLEVQVRGIDADAGIADVTDDLPGLDPLTVLDEVVEQVHVFGHQVVLVLDLHEQATWPHAVLADGAGFVEGHLSRALAGRVHAGIDDPPVGNGTHRLAERRDEVDALVRPLPLVADIADARR